MVVFSAENNRDPSTKNSLYQSSASTCPTDRSTSWNSVIAFFPTVPSAFSLPRLNCIGLRAPCARIVSYENDLEIRTDIKVGYLKLRMWHNIGK